MLPLPTSINIPPLSSIPKNVIVISPETLSLFDKDELIIFVSKLNTQKMKFECYDNIEINVLTEIDSEILLLVRFTINNGFVYLLILGSEF